MRIFTQTGAPRRRGRRGAFALGLALCASPLLTDQVASAQDGQIQCTVTENGAPGRGTFAVEQDGRRVASGSCGKSVSVPAGRSEVTVRLDGALDSPSKTVSVEVAAGKTAPVTVDFETGMLEVRIETKAQRGAGIVSVEKAGRRVGTIGSGVPARLSVGAYEVVVRLGGQEKRYSVELRAGQRRLVRAQF